MASRPRMALLVASITLAAACTTNTEVTNRTTPSDVFAPTPSIGGPGTTTTSTSSPPTTHPDVERGYIAKVDPSTLEELPDHEPIAMGDWMWGVTSDNGRWLALNTGDDDGFSTGLRLVDVETWEVAGEWPNVQNALTVTHTGVVYEQTDLTIGRVQVGALEEPVWTLTGNYSIWGGPVLADDRYVSYGRTIDDQGYEGRFIVLTGDETGGAVTSTPIDGVRVGLFDVVELIDGRVGVIEAYPMLVWDPHRQRALIVHATQDVVTEFDVATLESTDHVFGPEVQEPSDPAPPSTYPNDAGYWASTRRTAWLSPDGSRLYVSGTIGNLEEVDGAGRSVTAPSGLVVLDTSTWTTTGHLEIPVSDLYLSPDGTRLVATGGREVSTSSQYTLESSGWYLIDTTDLSVIRHVEADRPDQWFGGMSFSNTLDLAYLSSWGVTGRVEVIDLDTGDILATSEGDNLQVFGAAGVIGDVRDFGES